MKKLVPVILLCLYPLLALPHPGKTDGYGGHQCLKACEEWGLFYQEYHLHDKDWKPIRTNRKKQALSTPAPEQKAGQTIIEEKDTVAQPKTETVTRYVTVIREENMVSSNPLLVVLLALLFLLLILRMGRRKTQSSRPQ